MGKLPSPPQCRTSGFPLHLIRFINEEIKAEAKRRAKGAVSLETIRPPPMEST